MPITTMRVAQLPSRLAALQELLSRIRPLPEELLSAQSRQARSKSSAGPIEPLPCNDYRTLVQAWRKALRWTDGLDCGLSVMLASIASTMSVGCQLWVKVMGPASCGKSTLCEALSVNATYVLAKSTIRGFHSGYDSGDGQDHSLVSTIAGKTLVIKDGDTLLQSPNLGQILSEGRDIYDGVSRTHYRNAQSNDYTGIRMSWILCGTSSLRSIDSSELGERFLDCVIADRIDDDEEDEICWRVANRAFRNMSLEAGGAGGSDYEPSLTYAMQLTGGYISYLRENAIDLLSKLDASENALRQCDRLAKFVAYMRARPSEVQDEKAERELAYRLVEQHVRMASCLAIVLNRNEIDAEVLSRTTKVAMDTSRGVTLDLVDKLMKYGDGLEPAALSAAVNQTSTRTRDLLRFLKQIGVCECNLVPGTNGAMTAKQRWVLTSSVRKLYNQILKGKHNDC